MLEWTDEIKMKNIMELLFKGRDELLETVFDIYKPQTNINKNKMLSQMKYLSSGEYQLVELALHIWFNEGRIDLNAMVYLFDPHMFDRFIKCINLLRE